MAVALKKGGVVVERFVVELVPVDAMEASSLVELVEQLRAMLLRLTCSSSVLPAMVSTGPLALAQLFYLPSLSPVLFALYLILHHVHLPRPCV